MIPLNTILADDGEINLPILKKFNGETIQKPDLQGKILVMNFWASWCTSCLKELPELNALKKENTKKNIVFLAINAGESKKKIKKFLRKHSFDYQILQDPERKYSKNLNVLSLPQTIIYSTIQKKILYRSHVPPKLLSDIF